MTVPAQTVALGDCGHWSDSCGLNGFAWAAQEKYVASAGACNANQTWNQGANFARHNGGSNLCFCDGHASGSRDEHRRRGRAARSPVVRGEVESS